MKIQGKFRRIAAVFDEASRSSESGGEENCADLSDLVNSFLEREIGEQRNSVDRDKDGNVFDDEDEEIESKSTEFESRDLLNNLFDSENDAVKRRIHAEVEKAHREVGGGKSSSPDFKRRLVARLRNRGFDAGLCKSKWEKNERRPFGDYEYVDVNADGDRYIIEVFLAEEFTIARPTDGYAALLEVFPPIFVGKPDELKQVVSLMCTAIRKSMKSVGILMPPWRRHAYMQSKWFGSYKRTTNEIANRNGSIVGGSLSGSQRVGFVAAQRNSLYCREEFASKAGVGIGNLAAALNHKKMLL
ncbi:hypothetical protein DH2020_033009 [Rehmannia glutinosa]|uniref:DUF506 family protein n=1 Tax=Rehmannia glutinosa TaxID=99300 RepID=A0ABR0VFA1_REHGL